MRAEILKQNIDLTIYLSLYNPALDWIVQQLVLGVGDVILEDLLNQCKDKRNNSLLLVTILNSFRPEFVALKSLDFVSLLSESSCEGITRGALFRMLGNILSLFPPPIDQRLMVLNEAWLIINTITNIADYVPCVELWSEYVAKNFDLIIVDKFLGDVLVHVTSKRAFEKHYNELQGLVDKIATNTRDFEGLMTLVRRFYLKCGSFC